MYNVQLFEPAAGGGFQPVTIAEDFNGTINPSDARSTDPAESWPTLFQRAYLQLEAELGRDYHSPINAFKALTGQPASEYDLIGTGQTVSPTWLAQELNTGAPLTTATINYADPYNLDPGDGIMGDHSYTVMGIENASSSNISTIYLTLRNPWGTDTDPDYFDVDGDGVLDSAEWAQFQQGLDGNNDGIIRISWSNFEKYFSFVDASQITGVSINRPELAAPAFGKNWEPGPFNIQAGQQLGPINLSATDPHGLTVSYHIMAGCPGAVDANGQYTWVPQATETGTYFITVVAQSSPYSSASNTFEVRCAARPGDDWIGLRHPQFGRRHWYPARHRHGSGHLGSGRFSAERGLLDREFRERVRLTKRRLAR